MAATEHDTVSALSTDVRSHDDDNMSGYSGQREDGTTAYTAFYNRLTKFYLKYNPEKLNRVDEFLKAYRGEEEELFKLLCAKYGPEPDPPRGGSICSASDMGGNRTAMPTVVPPEVGRTPDPTPYWPGSKTVNDRDLCDVLETLQAANPDLAAAFMGVVKEHPAQASNGMTYISVTPVPSDGSRFLGHLWAGSLANNKVLVHKGVQYHRTVLHCTEQCSTAEFAHERWRLTMYRAEHTPNVLFRTVWDPEIRLEPPTFEGSQSASERRPFRVQYATRRRPASETGSSGALPPQPQPQPQTTNIIPHPQSRHVHVETGSAEGSSVSAYQQPQQPMALGPLELVLHHMQQLEVRLSTRLHSIEERIMNIETALLEPDQPV
jgi:hypothetical protein